MRRTLLLAGMVLFSDLTGRTLQAQASDSSRTATVAEWRRDIAEIVRHVRVTHPAPFTRVGENAFLRAAQALDDSLPAFTDEQRTVRAMRLVAMIGDAHTIVMPVTTRYAAWYPIKITEFTDGYFITSAHKSMPDLVGARVLEIGHRPIIVAAEAARDLLGADNQFWRKETLAALHNAALMKGIGFADADGSITIKATLRSGKTVDRRLGAQRSPAPFTRQQASLDWRFERTEVAGPPFAPFADWISAYKDLPARAYFTYDSARPPHLSQRSLIARAMPESDAYYIMINIWQATAKETIAEFMARAMRDVDRQRPKRLIIDLRYNPGGDGANAGPAVRELIARKNAQPWKDLYVLISGRTYSASIGFLGLIHQNVPATLVGEPFGGSYHGYGDYSTFDLPTTGLELRVSALRFDFSESSDIREVIPVDVFAPFSFADYAAGCDPAIDPIVRGDEMRSIPIVALDNGGAAARRVYEDRKRRFGGSIAWAPPTESELRAVGKQLLNENRVVDAIETFKLDTEINPTEWRSWYNLAEAQRGAGQLASAIANYRECLALNDPTNFHQDALPALITQLEKQATTK